MSDQEFFFEEETIEEAPAKAAKGGSVQQAPRAAAPAASSDGFFAQNVAMSVVALIGVICLLLGVIIGFFLAPKPVQTMPVVPGMGTGAAPSLSDEQMQQGMPAGHPPIDGTGGGMGVPAGEGEATTTP